MGIRYAVATTLLMLLTLGAGCDDEPTESSSSSSATTSAGFSSAEQSYAQATIEGLVSGFIAMFSGASASPTYYKLESEQANYGSQQCTPVTLLEGCPSAESCTDVSIGENSTAVFTWLQPLPLTCQFGSDTITYQEYSFTYETSQNETEMYVGFSGGISIVTTGSASAGASAFRYNSVWLVYNFQDQRFSDVTLDVSYAAFSAGANELRVIAGLDATSGNITGQVYADNVPVGSFEYSGAAFSWSWS